MSDSIPIKKLSKRWKMSEHELYYRFIKKGIPIYDDKGNPITPSDVYSKIEGIDPQSVEGINWNKIDLPGNETIASEMISELQNAHVDMAQVEGLEKKLKLKRERKQSPVQKHRLICRDVAKRLWKEEVKQGGKTSNTTEMTKQEEILKVSIRTNGKYYDDKTVWNWINDLNPKRKRGRPKKEEK
jgi:tRNA(Met) C34 N-acetyltransferase TmcA